MIHMKYTKREQRAMAALTDEEYEHIVKLMEEK